MIRQETSRKLLVVHRNRRGLRKILVALDGSSEGETVLDHLESIIAPRAVVVLIHVIPTPAPSTDQQLKEILNVEEEAKRYLERIQVRLPTFRSRWIVETGEPADRILAAAGQEDVDAIAMTSHARGRFASLLMGSVAREVVRRSGRPVFLVRPDVPPLPEPRRRILVPLAEPDGAEVVLGVVEALARQTNSEVILLHVLPFPRVADPVTGFNPIILKPIELPEVAWLDPMVDLLTHHGIRAAKSVLAGEPEEVLLRESRVQDVDLIAIRTRGRGGIARLILGGVTEQLLKKADRALLLFHRVEE